MECGIAISAQIASSSVIRGEFIAVANNSIKEKVEQRFPGLQMDSLGSIVGLKLIGYVNTTHIKIVLVYKLWNIYFFNRQVAEGLALNSRVGRGLCRSSAAPQDVGLTWRCIILAAENTWC